jgi:hypothetical protein
MKVLMTVEATHWTWLAAIGIGGAALFACSGRDTTLTVGIDGVGPSERVGQLDLPLVTDGRERYRLRQAVFDVTRAGGAPVASVNGEKSADAASASLDLAPGSYVVTLEAGWFLERWSAGGAERVSAALISPQSLAFDIRRGQVTDVEYVFSTIGGPLTLGASRLTVHAEVTPAAELPGCDVLDPLGCPSSETCLIAGDASASFCAQAGPLLVGAACSAQQCVAGAQCMYLDPALPEVGVCAAYCSPQAPPRGCDCQPLEVDEQIGVCMAGTGCTGEDCYGRVLVAGAPADPSWNLDVQAKLAQTGAFVGVDVLDVGQATPRLEDLQGYSAVLVYTDALLQDADGLGDNLADYFDAGGRVVVASFANATVSLGGRWSSGGYALIEPLGQAQSLESAALGLADPESPLLSGVTSLTATAAFRSQGGPIHGGVVVATWGSGAPLIVRGVHAERARVDLNLFPPSGDVRSDFWRGSGAEILRNALVFE